MNFSCLVLARSAMERVKKNAHRRMMVRAFGKSETFLRFWGMRAGHKGKFGSFR